ncbi:hypothetical protein BJ986_002035 [Phycicoccus badiiscoriae]|uniref:CARDB domain-containing protein n=1 Tax=Pedococcus badiiscoriae TaxID=642776 RepID=A0A852WEV9_9MICO|nr:hypothetical protein [Pedococcus badiiscoriae]NYG07548.1 hypothetical protein [Pedococcus badiiscoriae]
MDEQGSSRDGARPLLSRRSVALGAAWSVPVILLATAAPAAAASGVAPVIGARLVADKQPANQFGQKAMDFVMTLTNTGNAAGSVQVLSVTSSATTGSTVGVPTTVTVPAGDKVDVSFSYIYTGNAGTATYTVSYRTDGGPVQVVQVKA